MAIADVRLALLTFAQRWQPGSLDATVLILPSGDPTKPLLPGTVPFAGAGIRLRAAAVPGLDALPTLAAASEPLAVTAPGNQAALFAELATRFSPQDQTAMPAGTAPTRGVLRKALPDSYLAQLAPGHQPSSYVATSDEFGCTMRGQETFPPAATRPDPSWGEVVSYALRNPALANALGLRYTFTLPITALASYAAGGWLFVTLDPADGGTGYGAGWAAAADKVKVYAARLPPLNQTPRALFTPVLFPVANPAGSTATPDEAALDEAIIEAEAYDDGFAKLVHGRQPDSADAHVGDGDTNLNAATDAGIQVGWDDEQILSWQNRQIEIAHAALLGDPVGLEAPLGVQGYRLDVREPEPGEPVADRNVGWVSLMQASGTSPNGLVDNFDGDLVVEPTASAPGSPDRPSEFWLPLYFAQWRGTPIGVRDDIPHLLSGGVAAGKQPAVAPSAFIGKDVPALLYGHTYEFRVRLGDLSGGGPTVADLPVNETVAERAAVKFSRFVSPNGFGVITTPSPVTEVDLRRPTIGYPEALFTPRYGTRPEVRSAATAAMLAQLGLAPDGSPATADQRLPDTYTVGVPDPDVTTVEVRVEVRALSHDTGDDVSGDGVFTTVYTTARSIPPLPQLPEGAVTPTDILADVPIPPLMLDYVDVADIAIMSATTSGPLQLPRARDVRLVITPVASGPAGYFGSIEAPAGRPQPCRGASSHLLVRADSAAETDALFAAPADGRPAVQAFYFQPAAAGDPVAAMMADLADRLDLVADGLTLRALAGQRVVFGTSAGVAKTISADGGTLTFAAAADLFRKWTVALRYDLVRDWTWDGLAFRDDPTDQPVRADHPVVVSNGSRTIGAISVPRVATAEALTGTPDRSRTRLIFLDSIDPAVTDPADGFSERPPYTLTATMLDDSGAQLTQHTDPIALRLPVVIPPAGVPRLASAGYALSPYLAATDYSSTAARSRRLWLEVAEAPETGDALFARLLAYGPDPLLYVDPGVLHAEPPAEPALRLDPEPIRVITPGQPRDEDGLEAMTQLSPSAADPTRFLLPLPEGIDPDDPRLFGMWAYEVRFGHVGPWSTAHGRFGRPLRVTGVQHPAPALTCAASWLVMDPTPDSLTRYLMTSAPYAVPVLDGHRVGDGIPRSTIGFLLYAQACQSDRSGYRNVLLDHQGAQPVVEHDRINYGTAGFGERDIRYQLDALGLAATSPLSVLAVEFYSPGGTVGAEYVQQPGSAAVRPAADGSTHQTPGSTADPFAADTFGRQRILRTSPLVRVEPVC